jgi:fatty acid desaturase
MLAFGLTQVALFAPAHEATHQTAFASRRANQIVGWLVACPSLLNLHFYTAFHFAHHRHTQISGKDPELDIEAPDTLCAHMSGAFWGCLIGSCGCWWLPIAGEAI